MIDNNILPVRRWAHKTNIMYCGLIKVVPKAVATALCSGILILTVCSFVRGQDRRIADGKFDDFGNVKAEDAMARLDLFATHLNADSTSQGFIIGHNRADFLNGWLLRTAYGYLDYLVNRRGIPASRVSVLEGETRKNINFELWLLPIGAAPPGSIHSPSPEPAAPAQFDRVLLGNESECVGDLTIELYKLDDSLRFFGRALHQQPSAKAWIVVHPIMRDSSAKGLKITSSSRNLLVERYGIESQRILTAVGRPRLSICTEVNLWIAPSNSGKADEAGYYAQLMEEATQTEYNVRRVEFSGNQHIRDNTLRRRFVQQEGDVFSKKALEQSLKNFSKLRMIYPVTFNDVEVRLDREEKLMDFTIFFRER
jgi:hypothetical protein